MLKRLVQPKSDEFTAPIGLGELPTPDREQVRTLLTIIHHLPNVPLIAKQVTIFLINRTELARLALASLPETTFKQSELVDVALGCRDIAQASLFEKLGTGARLTVRRGVYQNNKWHETGFDGNGVTVFIGYEDRRTPSKSVLTPGTHEYADVVVDSFLPNPRELRRIKASF